MNKKLFIAAFALFALVCVVFAADWYPAVFKLSWNQRSSGFCSENSQCLVSSAGNKDYNSMPEKFFSDSMPQCIDNSQFILDFYCDAGSWSSRTKLIALELLGFASVNSPDDFSLFCAPFDIAVNNLDYTIDGVSAREYIDNCNPFGSDKNYPCVNSVCVLRYGEKVAFGTSLNIPVDNSRSFLKVLGKSEKLCSNVNNNNNFDLCGDNIWYNHDTNSIIVMPDKVNTLDFSSSTVDYFSFPLSKLSSKAVLSDFDLSSGIFSNLYVAKKNNKEVFSFMEKDQTDFGYDYIGVYMKDLQILNFCDLVLALDSNAVCEDSGDLLVIAKKTPEVEDSLVDLWVDLSAKLRLS